jgi:hypothetical protein
MAYDLNMNLVLPGWFPIFKGFAVFADELWSQVRNYQRLFPAEEVRGWQVVETCLRTFREKEDGQEVLVEDWRPKFSAN